jgi:hypothetical protein
VPEWSLGVRAVEQIDASDIRCDLQGQRLQPANPKTNTLAARDPLRADSVWPLQPSATFPQASLDPSDHPMLNHPTVVGGDGGAKLR